MDNTITRKLNIKELVNQAHKITYEPTPKIRTPKASSIASNGLSVENIRKQGHRICVHHYRAYYSSDVQKIIYLPSYTKYLKDQTIELQARGGYTRVAITPRHKEGSPYIQTALINGDTTEFYGETEIFTSYCVDWDLYCYKTGVRSALERVADEYAKDLLNGYLD